MSIIGPRPGDVESKDTYREDEKDKLLIRPGITGYTQAYYRNNLVSIIDRYIEEHKGKCQVYAAPFAVYLDERSNTYVEPDISVICDSNKLDDSGCKGAPDWVIEIVSPASKQMDYYTKLFKYRTAGIREYWIVDPSKNLVVVYNFELGETEQYTLQDSIKVGIYDELVIDFGSIEL